MYTKFISIKKIVHIKKFKKNSAQKKSTKKLVYRIHPQKNLLHKKNSLKKKVRKKTREKKPVRKIVHKIYTRKITLHKKNP